MRQADLSAADVDYVNAHATSTQAGDMAEYRALRAAIPGDHVRINSTKSMIGHLLGAAGAVEAIAAVQAIRTGKPDCSVPLLGILKRDHGHMKPLIWLTITDAPECAQNLWRSHAGCLQRWCLIADY